MDEVTEGGDEKTREDIEESDDWLGTPHCSVVFLCCVLLRS